MIIEFVAESKKPNEFKNNIIKCLKEQEINKEDVERVKKVKISLEVMEIDKPFRVSDSIIDHLLDFGDVIYNKMDLIRSITLEDILEVRNNILIDNNSYVVGYPKK
jgi:predicted Zn-dependent peptidase